MGNFHTSDTRGKGQAKHASRNCQLSHWRVREKRRSRAKNHWTWTQQHISRQSNGPTLIRTQNKASAGQSVNPREGCEGRIYTHSGLPLTLRECAGNSHRGGWCGRRNKKTFTSLRASREYKPQNGELHLNPRKKKREFSPWRQWMPEMLYHLTLPHSTSTEN